MTDADFLHAVLKDGGWHSQDEILARSQLERGHGLTVHSRAATLRDRGHIVECELRRNRNGRTRSFYRLVVTLDEPEVAGSSSGSSSVPAADGADLLAGSPSPLLEQTGTLVLFPDPVRGAYSGGEAA